MATKPKVLYLTRNSLLEPLGQSQVMSYLRGLSQHYQIILVTTEKPHQRADRVSVQQAELECESHGIIWYPLKFRPVPRYLGPMFELLCCLVFVLRQVRAGVRLIHARSYLPAAVATAAHRLTGVEFIFDMRALWADELILAGRLKEGSFVHSLIVQVEKTGIQRAASVVSLTHAAVEYLRLKYPGVLNLDRMSVIRTCVDLERFSLEAPQTDQTQSNQPVLGCAGTVLSGWFRINWVANFFATAAAQDENVCFELTTTDDLATVRQIMVDQGVPADRLTVSSAKPAQMPKILATQIGSVMFYETGPGRLGCCPTRMGEVLAVGRPVVVNRGVGDVAEMVEQYRVGVVVQHGGTDEMLAAWNSLQLLCGDPALPERCRQAAEAMFSLTDGVDAYHSIYQKILGVAND